MYTILEVMMWMYSFIMGYVVKLGFAVAGYMGSSENLFVILVCFLVIVKLVVVGVSWTLMWIGLSLPVVLLALVFQTEEPEIRMMDEAKTGVLVTKGIARISRIAGRGWEAERELPVLERQLLALEGMVKGQVRVRKHVQDAIARGDLKEAVALKAKEDWHRTNHDRKEFQPNPKVFSEIPRGQLHKVCHRTVDDAFQSRRPMHALEKLVTDESVGFTAQCPEEAVKHWVKRYHEITLNEDTPPEMFFVFGWGDIPTFR